MTSEVEAGEMSAHSDARAGWPIAFASEPDEDAA
jgi:hypothetical protein